MNKLLLPVIAILLLSIVFGSGVMQSLAGEMVYEPAYTWAWCADIDEVNMPSNTGEYLSKANTVELENGYFYKKIGRVANAPTHTLIYRVDKFVMSANIWKMPNSVTASQLKTTPWYKLGTLVEKVGPLTTTRDILTEPYNPEKEHLIIHVKDTLGGGDIDGNEVKYRVNSRVFGLVDVNHNNLLSVQPGTCDLKRLGFESTVEGVTLANTAFKEAYREGIITPNGFLAFNQKTIWITGRKLGTSALVIDSGTKYVKSIGEYYDIVEAQDGLKYVDFMHGSKNDPTIICIPTSPYCIGGRELLETPEGSDCSEYKMPPDFIQDNEQFCETKCVDGKVVLFNCKKIPVCGENERLNSKYQCVKITDISEQDDMVFPDWILYIIAGFVLVISIIIGITLKK